MKFLKIFKNSLEFRGQNLIILITLIQKNRSGQKFIFFGQKIYLTRPETDKSKVVSLSTRT